jgi:hypothetical protein
MMKQGTKKAGVPKKKKVLRDQSGHPEMRSVKAVQAK